jgi:hypothetical protein
MSALAAVHSNQPQAKDKPQQLRINGRNKAAIDAMVWEGLKRSDAAAKAGLTDHALYVALTKPHVRSYYMQQLDVLRTSERARNIHTLAEVRDQTSNQMARVQAVKALEQLDDDANPAAAAKSLPGLQIVIVQGGSAPPAIDVTPNSELARD